MIYRRGVHAPLFYKEMIDISEILFVVKYISKNICFMFYHFMIKYNDIFLKRYISVKNHANMIVCPSKFVINKFRDGRNFHHALSGYSKE